jgi:hypothetical protein
VKMVEPHFRITCNNWCIAKETFVNNWLEGD